MLGQMLQLVVFGDVWRRAVAKAHVTRWIDLIFAGLMTGWLQKEGVQCILACRAVWMHETTA